MRKKYNKNKYNLQLNFILSILFSHLVKYFYSYLQLLFRHYIPNQEEPITIIFHTIKVGKDYRENKELYNIIHEFGFRFCYCLTIFFVETLKLVLRANVISLVLTILLACLRVLTYFIRITFDILLFLSKFIFRKEN